MAVAVAKTSTESEVLAKALFNVQTELGLTQADLGLIIGKNRSSVSRLETKGEIDPATKEGELALLLISIYRSLFALMGSDKDNMRHWLNTENQHLKGIPLHLMQSNPGIVTVSEYLNAMRGKV